MLNPSNLYEFETQSRLEYQERLREAEQRRLAQLAMQAAKSQSDPSTPKLSLFFAFLRRLMPRGNPKIAPAKSIKSVRPIT